MLHELVQYAATHGIAGEAGFTPKLVRWLITFDSQGKFLGVVDLAGGDRKNKGREFPRVPHLMFSGDTPMRQFLVDTAKFAVLLGEKPPSKSASAAQRKEWEKLRRKHAFFLDMLHKAADVDPFLAVVARKLSDEQLCTEIRSELESQSPKAKPGDNVTFAEITTTGETRIVVALDHWHDWWRTFSASLFTTSELSAADMRCLITGRLSKARLKHPKINGIQGTTNPRFVSFDDAAYSSYGLQKSANAARVQPAIRATPRAASVPPAGRDSAGMTPGCL